MEAFRRRQPLDRLEIGGRLIVAPPGRRNDWPGRPFRHARFHPLERRSDRGWLWGWHSVVAALDNPRRAAPLRLVATRERAKTLSDRHDLGVEVEILETQAI